VRQDKFVYKDPAKPRKCHHCAILHMGICRATNSVELHELNRIASPKTHSTGEIIISEETPFSGYANIVNGVIKLTKNTRDGREQIIALLFSSDFFGRVYGDAARYNAIAVTDVELCVYPKTPFEKLLQQHPDLEHRLFKNVLDELDAARDWMLLLGRKNALEKVATLLLMLEKRLTQTRCQPECEKNAEYVAGDIAKDEEKLDEENLTLHRLPITRTEMADFLGLTMETVCRQMTFLKRQGVILLPDNHTFAILNHKRLKKEAG